MPSAGTPSGGSMGTSGGSGAQGSSSLNGGYSTGNAEWDAIFAEAAANGSFRPQDRPGAVYDPETGLTHNPNVALR